MGRSRPCLLATQTRAQQFQVAEHGGVGGYQIYGVARLRRFDQRLQRTLQIGFGLGDDTGVLESQRHVGGPGTSGHEAVRCGRQRLHSGVPPPRHVAAIGVEVPVRAVREAVEAQQLAAVGAAPHPQRRSPFAPGGAVLDLQEDGAQAALEHGARAYRARAQRSGAARRMLAERGRRSLA